MKVGLIGRGRLGALIENNLGQDTDLYVFDSENERQSPTRHAEFEQVCQAQIVIAAVPMSELEQVVTRAVPYLKKDTLFVDVCSVKVRPLETMKALLPKDVQILGTHPMFGPDSAAETLFGSKIVLCPERIAPALLEQITLYLEKAGLKVIISSPEEHDRQISSTLLLPHLIGRTLLELNAQSLEIDTLGYRRLMKILGVVENDSWQLFEDMIHLNPEASTTIKNFQEALERVLAKAHFN